MTTAKRAKSLKYKAFLSVRKNGKCVPSKPLIHKAKSALAPIPPFCYPKNKNSLHTSCVTTQTDYIMPNIAQIMIYETKDGEFAAELPGKNGIRHKVELKDGDWEPALRAALIERKLEIQDHDAMALSMKKQRLNRITEIDALDGHEINKSAIYTEKYSGYRIAIHKINTGGVICRINNKDVKTAGLGVLARFAEIAYALRAAREIIDTDPESYPFVEIPAKKNNTKRAPQGPGIDVDITNLEF